MKKQQVTLRTLAIRVKEKIIELNPPLVNNRWIRKNVGEGVASSIRDRLTNNRNGKGKNYQPFLNELYRVCPDAKKLWDYRGSLELTYGECRQNILLFIRHEAPEYIDTTFIKVNCPYEYDRLRKVILKKVGEVGAAWDKLYDSFPKKWRIRCKYPPVRFAS